MTAEGFQVLAQRLQQGEPALFPTDTLPALAAIPSAAQAIWQLKQRPADKPLILMGASVEQLLPCLGHLGRVCHDVRSPRASHPK